MPEQQFNGEKREIDEKCICIILAYANIFLLKTKWWILHVLAHIIAVLDGMQVAIKASTLPLLELTAGSRVQEMLERCFKVSNKECWAAYKFHSLQVRQVLNEVLSKLRKTELARNIGKLEGMLLLTPAAVAIFFYPCLVEQREEQTGFSECLPQLQAK